MKAQQREQQYSWIAVTNYGQWADSAGADGRERLQLIKRALTTHGFREVEVFLGDVSVRQEDTERAVEFLTFRGCNCEVLQ